MGGIRDSGDGTVVVEGADHIVVYTPRRVTLDDDTTVEHESQGGDMASVWAADLGGDLFVEVAHLGDGPRGGELVMTVSHLGSDQTRRYVAIGDLWADELPAHVAPSWPVAVDLALGLMDGDVHLVGTAHLGSPLTKADVETLHQRLLGAIHHGWRDADGEGAQHG